MGKAKIFSQKAMLFKLFEAALMLRGYKIYTCLLKNVRQCSISSNPAASYIFTKQTYAGIIICQKVQISDQIVDFTDHK